MGKTRISKPFNAEAALRAARGYHSTAALLERVYREEQASLKEGVNFTVDMVHEIISRVVSSTVLEALAVELVLKVRLSQAGIPIPKTHNHAKLFDHLPLSERKESGQRYRAIRHPTMRATIEEALAFSAAVFERWRYIHEHQSVEASMLEMQRAFNALAHDL
jgi:hypothetical protein